MPRTPRFVARASSHGRLTVAGALFVAVVAATALVLAPRTAEAEPAGDLRATPRPTAVLAPLVDPVGRLADVGRERAAATTASMIAVATPEPPPPAACPVPGSEFVDSWGFPRSGGRAHKGVDMMAPYGTPVFAPAAGTIRASNSSLGGLGFWLEGDDGTIYFGSHLASLHVSAGHVDAGTEIGTVGASGNAGTPHLHFEVQPGGVGVNPFPFAAQWCPAGVRAQ